MGCGGSSSRRSSIQHPLRAPIFPKKEPEHVDPHAGSKYCNDTIAKKWFLEADTDGSGGIDFEEFKKSSIGKALTLEEAKEIFSKTDVDNDGQIDMAEFSAALKTPTSPLGRAAIKAGLSNPNLGSSMSFPEENVIQSMSLYFFTVAKNHLCRMQQRNDTTKDATKK
jgi:hypothetical protein